MTSPTSRLAELGLRLPTPARPAFAYVPVVQHCELIFVSGQLPKVDGQVQATGIVGAGVTLAQARDAAIVCTLQGLACAAEHLGNLDLIDRVLRVTGFVASAPDFHEQPEGIDAASDLLEKTFGEDGRHARSAVGVCALPRAAPVEIEFIFTTDIPDNHRR